MTRGPKPSPNAQRRNVHPHAKTIANEVQAGRELPKALGIQTGGAKRFWKTWVTAPQTATWVETDWAELEVTTKLVDAFFLGDMKLAPEIRQRVAKWGATVEDRARLRMTIETDPDENEPESPSEAPSNSDMDEELYKLLNGS
ncbi:phage terminase small subunit [Streptomyces sp. NPDC055036]